MDDLFLDTYYFFVLIETYWNVKKLPDIQKLHQDCVLIETYWNVKVDLSIAKQYEVMY